MILRKKQYKEILETKDKKIVEQQLKQGKSLKTIELKERKDGSFGVEEE